MRTKEQGLLTTADAMAIVVDHQVPLEKMAHGGDLLAVGSCQGCKTLDEALAEWIAAHAASPEELAEMERTT
jgi:hypothetical protein